MPPTPPEIRIDEPGTFAHGVFHERHPRLIAQVLDGTPYGPAERDALRRLLAESTSATAVVEPPGDDAPDHARWTAWGQGMWGRRWAELPFLWAESWFYRRLLGAAGWFTDGGPWTGIDPFGPAKADGLGDAAVDGELAALDRLAGRAEAERRAALVTSALWGNRADLGFGLTAGDSTAGGLLADETAALWDVLDRAPGGTVCLVADNAGRELLPDLVLADHLLTTGVAGRVALYVKPHPYYVSDAVTADVLAAVARLRAAPGGAAADTGHRLRDALTAGTLELRAHPFLCAPLPFHDAPADLRAQWADATLTVLKGDLNYRRLVGDRLWPPVTPFATAAGWFPSPVAALRTLKSDVITGLDERVVADLDAGGGGWRTSGRYAVVQVLAR
ncbi:damage-control phosphatase ARMT1 family protein [Streptomyces sp. RFCAC02]|uniref:damage-control phosphatase ARMT1 family protein n=1 Tax=Streptomyces sp. RFCAC02 TaxID=2499143 RepID=UPI00101F0E24|nr:damage-control phosphatase ARMT1 family protein [Streptomyces sp. RFCAC02]